MHWSEADNVAGQIIGCGWTIRRMGKKRTLRGEATMVRIAKQRATTTKTDTNGKNATAPDKLPKDLHIDGSVVIESSAFKI
jgi:hypothetical protein